jgi:hypothetical protein
MKNIIIASVLLLALTACKNESNQNDLPIISVVNGKVQKQFVNSNLVAKKIVNLSKDLVHSTTETLEAIPSETNSPWQLTRISVGLGIEPAVKIPGDLFEAEMEAVLEFRFQKF